MRPENTSGSTAFQPAPRDNNNATSGPGAWTGLAVCSVCGKEAYTNEKRRKELIYFCRDHMPTWIKRFRAAAFYVMRRGNERGRKAAVAAK